MSNPPEKINIKFLKQYPEFLVYISKKSGKSGSAENTNNDNESTQTPEERIDSTHQRITTAIKSELLYKILSAFSRNLAHCLQGIEARILPVAIDQCQDDMVLLVHDGFVTKRPIDRVGLIKAVQVETGMEIEYSEEQLTTHTLS